MRGSIPPVTIPPDIPLGFDIFFLFGGLFPAPVLLSTSTVCMWNKRGGNIGQERNDFLEFMNEGYYVE